jgi:hypothetical protein
MILRNWLPKLGLVCVVVSVSIPINSVAGETDKKISLPEAIIYQTSEQKHSQEQWQEGRKSVRETIEQNQDLQNQEHKQWLQNQREKWERDRQEQREWQENQEELRDQAQQELLEMQEKRKEMRDNLRNRQEINPI